MPSGGRIIIEAARGEVVRETAAPLGKPAATYIRIKRDSTGIGMDEGTLAPGQGAIFHDEGDRARARA